MREWMTEEHHNQSTTEWHKNHNRRKNETFKQRPTKQNTKMKKYSSMGKLKNIMQKKYITFWSGIFYYQSLAH